MILQVFVPYSTLILGVFPLHQIMLGSARADALSYLAVKLFAKNSNLCDHAIMVPTRHGQTDGETDRQTDTQTDGRHTVA